MSVQGGIATTGNDRFHAIAQYAAESGGASAMDFMRKNYNHTTFWSAYVEPNNVNNPTVADFGRITSLTGNRTMQIGMQYVF